MWSYSNAKAAIAWTAVLLTGCGAFSGHKDERPDAGAAVAPRETAYRRIDTWRTNDTVYRDTTLLRLLSQEGVQVYGSYLWRPPGKDGRKGAISGTRTADTLRGLFSYSQEGGRYQDSLKIVFFRDGVVITQQSSEGYPITDTLTSVSE